MQIRCENCFEQYDDSYGVCHHCGYVHGTPAKELNHLYPGTVLNGRYIVGQVLGFGGFGITYKVWDQRLGTVLAIKEYYPSGLVNRVPGTMDVILFTSNRREEYRHGMTRFLDEARSMAKFSSHKSIINVFDFFEENDTAYIVMEYLEGTTLSAFLKTNRLDLANSISLILHVCEALRDIHAVGIVHRDVSPDNIFLCTNGLIKLIDFGAARFYADEERQLTIILKPGYAPPEQYERVNVQGPWTDIYALGATLYVMITGTKPEESTNRRVSDTLASPMELDSSIPENISNTIMKAMAIDKHLRFTSVADFEKALNNEKKVLPVAKEKKIRKRRRISTVTASALIIIISAVVLYLSIRPDPAPNANITIWYSLTGDAEMDEAKITAYAAITDEFVKNYPDVGITITTFPKDEYSAKINEAIINGAAPTLFESTGINSAVLANTTDLSSIVKQLNTSQYKELQPCNFYDRYAAYFPNKNQMPLGFTAPVLYINTTLIDYGDSGVQDISALAAQEIVLNNSDLQAFLAAYENAAYMVEADAKTVFTTGGAEVYFSDATEYFDIQEAMPGRYKLLRVDSDYVMGEFRNLWSIGLCSSDQKYAAEKLILFMLSDYAQEFIYIRNRSQALPINSNTLDLYSNIYNDFNGFFVNIENYSFPTTR
ncbi:MAG: serine/threonine-protein kinase [Oscillospiraceae bacterium]|nr:serine/threonine-protein kinase [Oscillospiraceae bacterium]